MVIRTAGDHLAAKARQVRVQLPIDLVDVRMKNLDGVNALVEHAWDELGMVGIDRRMGDRGQAAGGVDQGYGVCDTEALLLDVSGLPGTDQFVERLGDGRDVARLDWRASNVGTPHRSACCQLVDPFGPDRVSELSEALDDRVTAAVTRFPETPEAGRHSALLGIECVGQDV